MFPMNADSFRTSMIDSSRRMVELNRKALDLQLSSLKQGEKVFSSNIETSRQLFEAGVELQKATLQGWLDLMSPKTEAKA